MYERKEERGVGKYVGLPVGMYGLSMSMYIHVGM